MQYHALIAGSFIDLISAQKAFYPKDAANSLTAQSASDDGPIWNNAVLDHHHNAVLDHKAQVLHVGLPHISFVDNLNIAANPCILVNNGFAHNSVGTCNTALSV